MKRLAGIVAAAALTAFVAGAQESRMDWRWGRPGVLVSTNMPATLTINGIPWWTGTNGAFAVEGVGVDSGVSAPIATNISEHVASGLVGPLTSRIAGLESRTNEWNTAYGWGDHAGLYRAIDWVPTVADVTGLQTALDGKISPAGVSNIVNAATNGQTGVSAATVTNIAQASVTLAQARVNGDFGGTETISPGSVILPVDENNTLTTLSASGILMQDAYYLFQTTLSGVTVAEWQDDHWNYMSWSHRRAPGNYIAAATADITAHNADPTAHAGSVTDTNVYWYAAPVSAPLTTTDMRVADGKAAIIHPRFTAGGSTGNTWFITERMYQCPSMIRLPWHIGAFPTGTVVQIYSSSYYSVGTEIYSNVIGEADELYRDIVVTNSVAVPAYDSNLFLTVAYRANCAANRFIAVWQRPLCAGE